MQLYLEKVEQILQTDVPLVHPSAMRESVSPNNAFGDEKSLRFDSKSIS
jgi:hypothetical protein